MISRILCGRAAAAVATALAAAPAFAGPVWLEFVDAGSLPGAAGTPFGSGSLTKIAGTLNGTAAAGADFEDMFKIFISDPALFRASTDARDPITPGCAEFDTQLFLFRPTALNAVTALGVLGNNDHPSSNPGSPFSLLIPVPSDGSPPLTQCGIYYLAISGAGDMPRSAGGDIFFLGGATEISGADGPGGAQPVTTWSGGGPVGKYEIALKGVTFASCPWDCGDFNGNVAVFDFLALLGQWGVPGPCTCDFDGGGVGVVDFLALVGHWGPCPAAPDTNSCCAAHPNAGCDDPQCSGLVCLQLPHCCTVAWDPPCAALAIALCPACGLCEGN